MLNLLYKERNKIEADKIIVRLYFYYFLLEEFSFFTNNFA